MATWRLFFRRNERKGALTMPIRILFVAIIILSVVGLARSRAEADRPPVEAVAPAQPGSTAVVPGAEPSTMHIRAIPPGLVVRHHYYNPGTGEFSSAARVEPMGEPVYSNTPPPDVFLALGLPDIMVADDITTTAINGCPVSAYEFTVMGGGDGSGPGFNATFDLYDGCPHGGGQLIPDAGGVVPLPDDGLHEILVDLSASPLPAGRTVWLAVAVDSGEAGWVIGTPAQMGFTRNVYDFVYRQCEARFGGTTLYAGYHARVYCEPPFDREFLAYRNMDLTGMRFSQGGGEWTMDDIELIVDDCILSSYEIGAVGSGGGSVTVTAELRQFCPGGSVIDGTQATAQFIADDAPSLARFDLPGGVDLGVGQSLWMAFRFSRVSRAIVSGEATVGFTENSFGLANGNDCDLFSFGQGVPYAGFAISLHCLGDPPIGACCPRVEGEPCYDVTAPECSMPDAEWVIGQTCASEPFDPPCGSFVCCLPDPAPYGSCENLPPEECAVRGGLSEAPTLCGVGGQDCGWFACRGATGDACVSRNSPGCRGSACCNAICDLDQWCCEVAWDEVCVEEARAQCSYSCPSQEIDWVDPPAGVIDARMPHPLYDPSDTQGISGIVVNAPAHDGACCWTVCETDAPFDANAIADVTANGGGTFTVTFARPLTPGTITTVGYRAGWRTAEFGALPGDADGSRLVGPDDIIAIIDHLNAVAAPPWGLYSCDIDHSGECEPSDIVGVIDLLNGAGGLSSWMGATLPPAGTECP